MTNTLKLDMTAVMGCPTVRQHCWAMGRGYGAMPLEDISFVLYSVGSALELLKNALAVFEPIGRFAASPCCNQQGRQPRHG